MRRLRLVQLEYSLVCCIFGQWKNVTCPRNRGSFHRLETVYYDTPERLPFQRGMSLRVRRNGKHLAAASLQTISNRWSIPRPVWPPFRIERHIAVRHIADAT
jgi:hypothetical protein